jgi:hypothetical protein
MRALFFLLLRRLASGSNFNQFVRDSHRKSGVLSFLALLSPVDSCNPPELEELTTPCTPGGCGAQAKRRKKQSRRYPARSQQIDLWISHTALWHAGSF